MIPLHRRLAALEQATWDRRKREILRDAFAERAEVERWTPERFEREIRVALEDLDRVELGFKAMRRQGRTLHEVVTWIASEIGVDPDELIAEAECSGVLSGR